MKKLLIILFLISSVICLAQEKNTSVGIVGSIDQYNIRYAKKLFFFDHEYSANISYSWGLKFQKNVKDKLLFNTGILYSQIGYKMIFNYVFNDPNDPLIPKEANIKVSYITLPLNFGYYLIQKDKFKVFSSAGIVGEIYVDNKETVIFEDGSKKEINYLTFVTGFSRFLFSPQISSGLEYNFNEKMFFTVEAYLRYNFVKIEDNMLDIPFSYGGIVGINYKF